MERENQKSGSEAFRNAARDATLLYKGKLIIGSIIYLGRDIKAEMLLSVEVSGDTYVHVLCFPDGLEMARKLSDTGVTVGYNRRNKEILQWVRKRRRFIRYVACIVIVR